MKTIDITPTWLWVANVYLTIRDDKSNITAASGFERELLRLGPEMKAAILKRDDEAIIRICKEVDK